MTLTSGSTSRQARRVLVVFAHPDDGEFTAGGTIARWASEGSEIYYAVCTDGSKGSHDSKLPSEALVAKRQVEQQDAARILGVKEVIFLGRTDGELTPDQTLKKELVRIIRAVQPDALFTWDPWRSYQLHSDHRAAGLAALDAVMAAENAGYFPEQLGEGYSRTGWRKSTFLGQIAQMYGWTSLRPSSARCGLSASTAARLSALSLRLKKRSATGTGTWVRIEVLPTLKRSRYCGPIVKYAADRKYAGCR